MSLQASRAKAGTYDTAPLVGSRKHAGNKVEVSRLGQCSKLDNAAAVWIASFRLASTA